MRRGLGITGLVFAGLLVGLLAGAESAPACGGYDLDVIVLRAIADCPRSPLPVEELRAQGPRALGQLFKLRDQMSAEHAKLLASTPTGEVQTKTEAQSEANSLSRRLARLDELIDQVGKQRYCSRSRLFWYTDLEEAKSAARASGKPILSLRMLGNLDEDFSCANSRFFRTTLYANAAISQTLRDNFVLHWKSVRPVPKVTIDFGNGRKLERTLTGNSIHYVLTPSGEVVEALPGLYGPKAFLEKVNDARSLVQRVIAMPAEDRGQALSAHHAERFAALGEQFASDMAKIGAPEQNRLDTKPQEAPSPEPRVQASTPRAVAANEIARPKSRAERPLVAAALPTTTTPESLQDEAIWQAIAALHAADAEIDSASRELIRSENPNAADAGRLAITKRVVEDPMLRLVRTLQESIALDTVRNEYQLHRRIHQWLASESYRPQVEVLNEQVYAELFLTPSTDPWLGLAPADAYTALPNGGVVRADR